MRRPAGVWRSRSIGSHASGAVLLGPELVHVRPHHEPGLGVLDGGLTDLGPRQGAELALGLPVSSQASRHRHRLIADVVDVPAQDEAEAVARLALDQVSPHVGPGRGRGPAVKIDEGVDAPPGQVELETSEAGDAGHHGIDHALHERAGDGGVDGVPATAEGLGSGLDGLRLGGDDHSVGHRDSPPSLGARVRRERSDCGSGRGPAARLGTRSGTEGVGEPEQPPAGNLAASAGHWRPGGYRTPRRAAAICRASGVRTENRAQSWAAVRRRAWVRLRIASIMEECRNRSGRRRRPGLLGLPVVPGQGGCHGGRSPGRPSPSGLAREILAIAVTARVRGGSPRASIWWPGSHRP